MRSRAVAEWVGFQMVWLACAIGAAQGRSVPGIIAAALFISAVLTVKKWPPSDCFAVLVSGVVGLIAESALVSTGLVRFAAPWPIAQLAPAWIGALWLAFGATLSAMDALLGQHSIAKAIAIGFVAGPLAYWAGARFGALEIIGSAPLTYFTIAAIWAVALPSLLSLRKRWKP